MKRTAAIAAGILVFASSCGGSDKPVAKTASSGLGATTSTVDRVSLAEQCDAKAFASAQKPINITYWHTLSETSVNKDALRRLTDRFNASQSEVKVTYASQGSSEDTLTKYKGLAGKPGAPDLLQLGETSLQTMIDSKAIVPAQACADATKSSFDDMLPRVHDYYTVAGATWAMPFNVSQPVLLYNKLAFKKAGLDPEKPPTDFDSLVTVVKALHDKGGYKYGMHYKRDTWVLEQFLALAGEPYVDHDNGRAGRATAAIFNTPTAKKVLKTLQELVRGKVATTNSADGPEQFSNLVGMCNGDSALTFDSSAALGTAYDTLAKGQCKEKIEVGVAALPLPSGPGKGGTLVGGAANFIARQKDPHSPKVLAAFKYAQFLTTPEAQAEWAAATGYIPVSKGAAKEVAITSVWTTKPGYKVAYDELSNGAQNIATAGPLIGAYKDVRTAIKTALESLFIDNGDLDSVLQTALAGADTAIKDYNRSNG